MFEFHKEIVVIVSVVVGCVSVNQRSGEIDTLDVGWLYTFVDGESIVS